MNTLQTFGWNDLRAAEWAAGSFDGYFPARVTADHGRHYRVAMPQQVSAHLSGSLVHKLKTIEMPKIGDWVAVMVDPDGSAVIEAVLPRTSEIVRGNAGKLLDKQVIAANIDLAFIMQPLDHDFSPERIERYLFQLSRQNIRAVILLNKFDKVSDANDKRAALKSLGVETLIMSAINDPDTSAIEKFIIPGETAVVLGSSGAGKSTLVNKLIGEEVQATQTIRERDSKGRHTTVHRELFVLPGGGLIIDTPGIRELQLWGDEAELEASFPEIVEVAWRCHYTNCSHTNEDRCAINNALAEGAIDKRRYSAYLNFKRELETLQARRGFIDERRSAQSRESAARRRKHSIRNIRYDELDDDL